MPEKSEDVTNMSEISKQTEFFEAIKQQAITENDASKLEYANAKLAELESGAQPVELDLPEVSRTPYEFIQKINFDEYAKLEGNMLNSIVQTLLNMKQVAVEEQVTAQYEAKIQAITTGFEEERTNWEYQSRKLQSELQSVTTEKNEYKNKAEDIESRFKALELKYNEDMAEKDAEIKRMKLHEADLHDQIARAPAPTARPIIDISASSDELEELIRIAKEQKYAEEKRVEEERLAKRPRITNKRWENEYGVKNAYLAELVGSYPGIGKDGDTIRIGMFDINQYLEVTADDAARFRAEQIAEQGNTDSTEVVVENSPLVIPVAQTVQDFRADGVNTAEAEVPESAEPSVSGGVVPQTLEERVISLEKRVAELETVCA